MFAIKKMVVEGKRVDCSSVSFENSYLHPPRVIFEIDDMPKKFREMPPKLLRYKAVLRDRWELKGSLIWHSHPGEYTSHDFVLIAPGFFPVRLLRSAWHGAKYGFKDCCGSYVQWRFLMKQSGENAEFERMVFFRGLNPASAPH